MLFLCDLPNPVHGMSNVNKAILEKSIQWGLKPEVINTVPSYAAKFFGGPLWGIVKIFHSLICFFRLFKLLVFNKSRLVYRPINGGSGQLYDVFYIFLIRVFRAELIIHHHSFNYLNKSSRLFSVLVALSGSKARHVVLGDIMGRQLCERYSISSEQVCVLSNVAFFESLGRSNRLMSEHLKIGHLANLCVDKGVTDFISICRELVDKNVLFNAVLAGPFADDVAKKIVESAIIEIPQLKYLGPLYGEDKDKFFQDLDVFIFPSHYCNEAEPLVLYEAAQCGVLNFGTRRGCMESVINSLGGISFEEGDGLVEDMCVSLMALESQGALSVSAINNRYKLFASAKKDAALSLEQVLYVQAK